MKLPLVAVAPLAPHRRVNRQKVIARRWRKANMGARLYWRDSHPRWRWDSGEIARAMDDGTGSHSFYSLDAIEAWIEAVGTE